MRQGRLRIAIFSNAYRPTISGVVTSVCQFRQGLLARGHDVHVFTPRVEHYEDEEPYVFRLPALIDLNKAYEISLALPVRWPMKRTIQGIKPHLIHSQHPVLVGDLAMRWARDLRLPLVFTFHTRYDAVLQSYLSALSDWAGQVARDVVRDYLGHCAHVIAPTDSIRRMLYREYDVDVPVTVLPTPIDLARFRDLDPAPVRQQYGIQDREVLLYLGRISPEKGLDLLIEAFARVHARRTQAVLLIVGRGPSVEDLQEQVQELGLGEHVRFTGAVPYADVPKHMAAADLFVFPSRAETQGLVLFEAMAADTPVVAVRSPGASDALAAGQGGVLVRPDADSLAEAVLVALNQPGDREEMRDRARRIVAQYSIESATERLLAVYERAIARGPVSYEDEGQGAL
jgi:glycosyltransferase involved in cell wall biosynthesis